jgi:hypothetical protein
MSELNLPTNHTKMDTDAHYRCPRCLRKGPDAAKLEARSISQTCEILLRLGGESYEKEGSKYVQRFLSRQKKDNPSE